MLRDGVSMPRRRAATRREDGFTLIEALVALSILAIAASALMAATGAHIGRVKRLEERAVAELVAENLLVDLRLAKGRPSATTDRVTMARQEWTVETVPAQTSDPDLVDVKISVSASAESHSLITLEGFIDAGARP